jgi:DNA mismatch repair protein MutL
MSKYINILPEIIINKIAAGEVIQRPESAVKELIENAIDAGSTTIKLLVKDAGKTLIQVIDNGSGIYPEDAEVCFIRHSTSKIFSEDDLEAIHTLGFRGEALASMAAVAQVELKTRTEDAELGTMVNIENSKVVNKEPCSCEKGTSVSIKNLYYNTPARRNFLKSDSTELKHIVDTFMRFCISYPEIKFIFINNGSIVYDLDSSDLFDRIVSVFKNYKKESFEKKEDIIYFTETLDFLQIKGFIAKPQFLRKNKGEQYIFLNRRYIQNRMINHAISTAYETATRVSGYPFFILFLSIDPKKIDVNVHPSKLEAKFDDERAIYHIITTVIKKSLASSDLTPGLDLENTNIGFGFEKKLTDDNFKNIPNKMSSNDWSFKEKSFEKNGNWQSSNKEQWAKPVSRNDKTFLLSDYSNLYKADDYTKPTVINEGEQSKKEEDIFLTFDDDTNPNHKSINTGQIVPLNVWQIHCKYIVAQIASGIIVIDQHVAHERILYEKALKFLNNKIPLSQQLLFPITINLSLQDYEIAKELLEDLKNLGFEIKLFSNNSVVLDGIPSDVKLGNEENILKEIIYDIRNYKEPNMDTKDFLAKTFSCKAAIKFGDSLSQIEMMALIDQLFATEMPYVCPHGRPIVVKISVDELDKKFGRK